MAYYQLLGLKKEPFSISPDPSFFFRSGSHTQALQRLEILLRLKRGLGLILGDVGTGKTTLGRVLVRAFQDEPNVAFHMILNPVFQSEFQFLEYLCKTFQVTSPLRSSMDCMEALQNHLYRRGVEEGKTTVLLIDEGQNLSSSLIEILRSLLNFETNDSKLLQLVILAQMEALPRFQRIRNFMDRVALKYILNPFGEEETRRMIRFRLAEAGARSEGPLFTDDAVRLIHYRTQGYPRKINQLCQKAMEVLATGGRRVVDVGTVNEVSAEVCEGVEEA
jgi:general secretion pathway protein A